jgi:hypothetical protein
MRQTPWLDAEPHRLPNFSGQYGDSFGAFIIPHGSTGVRLRVLVSNGRDTSMSDDYAWEHVSVSLPNRCPNWPEMSFIKSLFWEDEETVMQLHVPASEYRNLHPHCLHLWRPLRAEIPRPPNDTVAVPGDLNANRDYANR